MSRKPSYEFNNLTKTQQDCLALIESLGIYELRALARVFGDNSPTTLKRDDHIQIVMNKIIAGEELKFLPLRQGRPYKELSNIENILNELSALTGNDYTLKGTKPIANFSQKVISFKQVEDEVVARQLFPIKAKGILFENENGDYYFHNEYNFKFVLVKKELDPNIKPLDYIEGTAVLMNEKKDYLLTEIEKINFTDKNESNKNSAKTSEIIVNQNTIKLGTRNKVNMTNFVDNADQISTYLETFKKNDIKTIAIIPNVMDEDIMTIHSMGFDETILFKYNDSTYETYNTCLQLNNYIKHQQEEGNSVAIFVQDIVSIINIVDYCYKNSPKCMMNHTENSVEFIKNFGSLPAKYQNDTTITEFVTFDNADMFDPLYVSLIYKTFKTIEL